ncbi:MAG: HmuY family protein [Bacteroidota bacterium]
MKQLYLLLILLLVLSSCEKDDPQPPSTGGGDLEILTTSDLIADADSTNLYTFFSLRENKVIPNSDSATTNWDIAFRGTTILTNNGTSGPGMGGAQVIDGIFDELAQAPVDGYDIDDILGTAIPTGSGNGWYLYTASNTPVHAILPIAGKIIVIRTADERYAKMEIQSYYEGNPNTTTPEFADLSTRPPSRYYTFRFVFQEDGSLNF